MGRRRMPLPFQVAIATGIGFFGSLAIAQTDIPLSDVQSFFSGSGDSGAPCEIKGNISHNTGERIYHVPGQRYYDETVINPLAGERWFCSESDARAAGWRRSRV